jgi:hypothetical protein
MFSGFYNRSLGNRILASKAVSCSRDGIDPYGGDFGLGCVVCGLHPPRNVGICLYLEPCNLNIRRFFQHSFLCVFVHESCHKYRITEGHQEINNKFIAIVRPSEVKHTSATMQNCCVLIYLKIEVQFRKIYQRNICVLTVIRIYITAFWYVTPSLILVLLQVCLLILRANNA